MTLLDIAEQPEPVYKTPKKTRTELVADYFRSHPNEWIDGLVFAEFAGAYAWRSRISEARASGMVIENRQRMSMSSGKTISEYRFVPNTSARE
jgi:hypothetical protein